MLEWLNTRWPGLRRAALGPFVVKINPNFVTAAALVVAMVAGAAFWWQLLLLAALLVLLNGFLDILDGEIAAKYGRSGRGDLLDHTADRFADIAILAGITASGLIEPRLGVATIIVVILVSYLGTEAQALTRKRLYAGLLGRADRLVLIAVGAVAEVFWPSALRLAVIALLLLSVITFGQRFGMLWQTLR